MNVLFAINIFGLVILVVMASIILKLLSSKSGLKESNREMLNEILKKGEDSDMRNRSEIKDMIMSGNTQIIEKMVNGNYENTNKINENLNNKFTNYLAEQTKNFKDFGDGIERQIEKEFVFTKTMLGSQLQTIKQENESLKKQIQLIQDNIENKLKEMVQYNEKKLNDMQNMINEKLKENIVESLEKAFQNINQNMKNLQSELGKISSVSTEVNSLRKVLSANKTAGTWGEVMLRDILNDILGSEYFEEQKMIKKNMKEKVDFAIKIPTANDKIIILPIDSKFNLGKYEEYIDSSENEKKVKRDEFFKAVKISATQIAKYIDPPTTTDFAIMYIPSEGVYAEIAQNFKLVQEMRDVYRIIIAGPNNIVAMLQSLKIGFQSLNVHKKSYEVIKALKSFSKIFGYFTNDLEESSKLVQKASDKIESVRKRRETIANQLKEFESLELTNGGDKQLLGDKNEN